ncbi:MAG: ribose transport system substrate-binding protein, partial [Actinomycetota bacterium]|nr:ribose transport system substrate-binding protein [Actinomycetota bacterium]
MWRRGAVAIAAAGLLAGCGSSTTGGTTTEAQADTAAPAAVSDAPDQLKSFATEPQSGLNKDINDAFKRFAVPSVSEATQKVLDFSAQLESGESKAGQGKKIAYVTECATENAYCLTRLKAVQATVKKYGATMKIFNAAFDAGKQLSVAQTASTGDFDGFMFGPVAGKLGCRIWKQYLRPTGKPIINMDIPMCGNAEHTPGMAATLTMQSTPYFMAQLAHAFSSCKAKCKVIAIGGFTGTDLFGYWQTALRTEAAAYPNVEIVVDQAANFDPTKGFAAVQTGLRAHPDASVVVSSWDDMTRGAIRAIEAAGKKPGEDVRVYSAGGSKAAADLIRQGKWTSTTPLQPYEEGVYGLAALLMAMEGKAVNAWINEAEFPAIVPDGTGSLFVTKDNVDKLKPRF